MQIRTHSRRGILARGQLLPLSALAIFPIMLFVAIAVDAGYWRDEQRKQQSAADSAALAGAVEHAYPAGTASPAPWITAARNDAASNGFTDDGGSTVSVTVNNPPSSGSYTGSSTAVEVLVKAKHPTFFWGAFGKGSTWITARAVADLTNAGAGCIVTLNAGYTPYTMQVTGGTVNASSCAIVDDGTYNSTGGTINAEAIGVVGAINNTAGTYPQATPKAALMESDPCQSIAGCAYLANNPPATSPCDYTGYRVSGGTVTLSPGVYCSGLTISGGTATLNPGLYVVTGSQFKLSGGTLSGTGVTFYIASGSSIDLSGGTPSLSAPTSGNTAGMLFYQPASDTTAAKLTGTAGSTCPAGTVFHGIFYLPGAFLNVSGGYWDPSAVIVGSMNVSGGSLTCMTSPTAVTNSVARGVLVE